MKTALKFIDLVKTARSKYIILYRLCPFPFNSQALSCESHCMLVATAFLCWSRVPWPNITSYFFSKNKGLKVLVSFHLWCVGRNSLQNTKTSHMTRIFRYWDFGERFGGVGWRPRFWSVDLWLKFSKGLGTDCSIFQMTEALTNCQWQVRVGSTAVRESWMKSRETCQTPAVGQSLKNRRFMRRFMGFIGTWLQSPWISTVTTMRWD